MTREEIKNTPEIVDFMLDKSVMADSRRKLHKRLEEICELAIKALEQEPYSDAISREDTIDILLNEMECVQRASDEECNRDCAKCDLLRDTDKILQAYRIAIRALEHPEENVVAIIPCGDAIDRAEAIKIASGYCHPANIPKELAKLPPVNPQEPKTGHCKDCKYFEYDSVAKVDGIPLIVAHEICSRWGDGCKTREDGYCFLFEPQESEVEE